MIARSIEKENNVCLLNGICDTSVLLLLFEIGHETCMQCKIMYEYEITKITDATYTWYFTISNWKYGLLICYSIKIKAFFSLSIVTWCFWIMCQLVRYNTFANEQMMIIVCHTIEEKILTISVIWINNSNR